MRNTAILLASAVVLLSSCAKSAVDNTGLLAEMAFNAWAQTNKESSWEQTPLGSWIIEKNIDASRPSLGSVDDYPYIRMEYTITDLNGNISSSSDPMIAKQLGTWAQSNYYGPQMSSRASSNIYAGIEEVLNDMHIGDEIKLAIPGWLLTNSRYDDKQGYIDAMTSSTDALIYKFKVVEMVADTEKWELELIKNAMGADWEKADSLDTGVYYVRDVESDKPDTELTSGSSAHINYICRRIDGTGVDTSIADSAKVFGTYSASRTYGKVLVNWASEASEITITSDKSSVVSGFSAAIFQMKPHEKGRVYMTSSFAYGTSGSGDSIPAYCPIYFELEFLDTDNN